MTKDRKDLVLQYLNPKVRAILDEEGFDVRLGREKERLDYKTIFMNAVLQSSKQNEDALTLTQKDLAFYFNITDQAVYYYLERIEDSGKPATNNMDVPDRYLPCLVSGLAYNIALKRPESASLAPALKQIYEEQWEMVSDAFREKAALYVTPGGNNIL